MRSGEIFDVAVVGGGMVGSAIAHGMAQSGARVALLDEGDLALRAARGNFGLVWTQSKGDGMPEYVQLTRQSARAWPGFAETIAGHAGRDIGYRNKGGLSFCLGEADFAEKSQDVQRLHNQSGTLAPDTVMLDRHELRALMRGTSLGEDVSGAAFCRDDGHVNPLYLLRGLHAGLRDAGGVHLPGPPVHGIAPVTEGFAIDREGFSARARKVVIAAGVHTTRLASMVGIDLPVFPVRGQNMVTEKLPPLLPLPASAIRQTQEGVVQIGVSYEEHEWDSGTTVHELARMARRAVRIVPALRHARVVRAWAALRPMTPDGFPAYAASAEFPGAFAAACHSGVTLSAAHAQVVAPAMLSGDLASLAAFAPSRFTGETKNVRADH